jgi:hypothetical protein
MNKIENLIYKKNGVMVVDVDKLIDNEVNKELYASETAENAKVEELAISMRKEMDAGFSPNKVAIQIHPDGTIDSGHTRKKAAKIIGALTMKAEYTTNPYPKKETPYTNVRSVKSTNIYRSITPSVKLDNYEVEMNAYYKEYSDDMPNNIHKMLLKELQTNKKTLDQLSLIKQVRPDLLPDIDKNSTSIEYAHNIATGKANKVIPKKETPM